MSDRIIFGLDEEEKNIASSGLNSVEYALKENMYGRNDELKEFIEKLDTIESNIMISIDGQFGTGKTFFVKQLNYVLKHFSNEQLENNDGWYKDSIFKNMKLKHTYSIFYFDAKKYDDHTEPILALVADIADNNKNVNVKMSDGQTMLEKIVSLAGAMSFSFGKMQVNLDAKRITDSVIGENIVESVQNKKRTQEFIIELFRELIYEKSNKIVIIIDELDACRPKFAIELLEQLKNYIVDDRFICLCAIDKVQMVHILRAYYGDEFEATRYLNRFFNLNYSLKEISYETIREDLIIRNKEYKEWLEFDDQLVKVVDNLARQYDLSTKEYLFFLEQLVAAMIKFNREYDEEFSHNGDRIIEIFVCIIILLDMVDSVEKKKFLNGRSQTFRNVLKRIKGLSGYIIDSEDEDEENSEVGYNYILDVYDDQFGEDMSMFENGWDQMNKDENRNAYGSQIVSIKEICLDLARGYYEYSSFISNKVDDESNSNN